MTVEGKQNLLFPMGPVIKRFVIPHNSKIEQIINSLLDAPLTHICRSFKVHELIT